jgi:tetratricopeptide (TPR) repeat protein
VKFYEDVRNLIEVLCSLFQSTSPLLRCGVNQVLVMSKPIEQFLTDQQYVEPENSPHNLGESEHTTNNRVCSGRSDFWYLQEAALGQASRYADIIAAYDRAIAINPNNSETWYFRGVVLGKEGRYEEAIISYGRALAINPNNSKAWYYRAAALNKVGRDEEAMSSYARVVAINPDNADSWYYLGTLLGQVGRGEDAIYSYDRAISLKPQDFRAYYNRGRLKEALNDLAGAISDFNEALALKPKFASSYVSRSFLKEKKINQQAFPAIGFRNRNKPSIYNWQAPMRQAKLLSVGKANLPTNPVYEIQHTSPPGNSAICVTGFHTQDKRWQSA